jgi:sugar (pentulose or hexulose) kinase
MNSETYYLVVNLGLRSNRVIIFDESGEKVAENSRQLQTRVSADKVEQDPEQWWALTSELISSLDKRIRDSVRYLTVTSSSCNLVCSDEAGQAVSDALLVSDKRSKHQAERFAQDEQLEYVFQQSNFSASPSYMFPKIYWLAENEPAVFDRTDVFGSSNSYLTQKFTTRSVTDYLDAEKFYYDRDTGYPSDLLDRLDLTERNFPDVVPVGTDIGTISPEVAAELGLPSDVSFIVTTYDALAAFWGSGAVSKGDGANVCGTSSSLRTAMPDSANLDLSGSKIKAQYFSRAGTLAVGASNSLEGGLLEWAKSNFYADSDKTDNAVFDQMESDATESAPGANGLLFLPYLLGERAPFDDPDARGMLFGLERKHDRSDIIRSIFDSIGFLTRHMIEKIEDEGAEVNRLKAAGGLIRRKLACQIKADATGKPVILVDELESTALGCMIITKSTAEQRNMQAVAEDMVDYGKRFDPNPKAHERYSKLYPLFKELYQGNKDNFQRRADIINEFEFDGETDNRQL